MGTSVSPLVEADSDSDSEFEDPDQQELHPFLLQQRNKVGRCGLALSNPR
jgi:hypothetical protein